MWYYHYSNDHVAENWPIEYRQNNANNIAYYFVDLLHWTLDSVCAMLGNMQAESYLNPAQWEHGHPVGVRGRWGYGLVQWTPWYKYTDWAEQEGMDWRTYFDGELYRIQYEMLQGEGFQWITRQEYPLSFYEFTQATTADYSLDWLTMCFFSNYERGEGGEQARKNNAAYWYQYFTGHPPTPPTPEPTQRRKFPIMFYLKPKWKRGF